MAINSEFITYKFFQMNKRALFFNRKKFLQKIYWIDEYEAL